MLHILEFRQLFKHFWCLLYGAKNSILQSSYTVYIFIFYFCFVFLNYYAIGIHLQYILFLAIKIMKYIYVSYFLFFNYLCVNDVQITLKVIYTNEELKIWYYFHPYINKYLVDSKHTWNILSQINFELFFDYFFKVETLEVAISKSLLKVYFIVRAYLEVYLK